MEVCYEDNPLQCVYVCDTLEPTFSRFSESEKGERQDCDSLRGVRRKIQDEYEIQSEHAIP